MQSIFLPVSEMITILREVTFGDQGAFKTIKKGSIYIDNTTASATIAREIYDFAKKK